MPTYDTISLDGINVESASWHGDVLRAKFGNGYRASALVGRISGLHKWVLSDGGVSPDRTTGDASGSEIDSVSRFEYYWEFFKAHTTGTTEVFILEWRGKFWHAAFSDTEISAEQMTYDLFGITGVNVEQVSVEGIIYEDDGSIDLTPPTTPAGLGASVDGAEITLTWSASADDDPDADLTPPSVPTGLAGDAFASTAIGATWDASTD